MANGAGNGTGGKKNGLRNGSGIATIEHSENKEKTQKEINIMSEIRKIENSTYPSCDRKKNKIKLPNSFVPRNRKNGKNV